MAGRGVPLHPDAAQARVLANNKINGFRGLPVMPGDLLEFVQDAVRDSLNVAPQPVSETWVKSTLAIVSSLVRTVAAEGGAVSREHVFSQRVRDRFLYVHMANYAPNSVNGYRSRLDLITMALNGVTIREPDSQPKLANSIPQEPCTRQQEETLYAWCTGLRPDTRRQRMTALIVVGLGVGPKTPELLRLTSDHVTADADGVHVRLTNGHGVERVVTCRREWEQRLLEVVAITPPGHYLIAPWRDAEPASGGFHLTVWQAQEKYTPPVFVNCGRLRNTWVVRQLEAGVPLATLMAATDLETGMTLHRLLPFCERQDARQTAASLRGSR